MKVAVIGLGYVGLPVALGLAEHHDVIGFDIDEARVTGLIKGDDRNGEHHVAPGGPWTNDPVRLAGCDVYVLTVPTPITDAREPDLKPLLAACRTVGEHMSKGATVIIESTVYPGCTTLECVPALEAASGLTWRQDFHVGYSPERINPGDDEHTFHSIAKVIAGDDDETTDLMAALYGHAVESLHRAPSIEVAEAAKVMENTQRDVNVALVNELALICHRLGIDTGDVLAAAGTKWNFLHFTPGLVGGHCIGVDPYYLTHRAAQVGHEAQVILAGRRVNDGMGAHIARRVIDWLKEHGGDAATILGVTFKEDVADLRNSRVVDIREALCAAGITVQAHDPLADPESARKHGWNLVHEADLNPADALILAVPHRAFDDLDLEDLVRENGLFFDVKGAYRGRSPKGRHVQRL